MTIDNVAWYNASKTAYILTQNSTTMIVPNDPNNFEKKLINNWINSGNTVKDYVPLPVMVPSSISRRQFYQQLFYEGLISQTEALTAVSNGILPKFIQNIVDSLPLANKFDTQMLFIAANSIERYNPLTLMFSQQEGWTSNRTDDFFTKAGNL